MAKLLESHLVSAIIRLTMARLTQGVGTKCCKKACSCIAYIFLKIYVERGMHKSLTSEPDHEGEGGGEGGYLVIEAPDIL